MFTVMHAHTLTFPKVHGHNLYFDLQTCRVGHRKSHIAHHQYPIGPQSAQSGEQFWVWAAFDSTPDTSHQSIAHITLDQGLWIWNSTASTCLNLKVEWLSTSAEGPPNPAPPPHLWVDGGGRSATPKYSTPHWELWLDHAILVIHSGSSHRCCHSVMAQTKFQGSGRCGRCKTCVLGLRWNLWRPKLQWLLKLCWSHRVIRVI